MALLWVKLNTENISGADRRSIVAGIIGGGDDIVFSTTLEIVGMEKIEERGLIEITEEWVIRNRPHVVPAHVWKKGSRL